MVLTHGEGAWVTDVDGRRYLDCLAGYSALNFGHGHPRLVARAQEQLTRLTLTSRAFHNDQLGPFAAGPGRPHRQGPHPADEHRRRGRRDRPEGRPQVGLPGQGRAREHRQHRRHGGQLPRPHHHHRQLLRRQDRPRRVRPLHTGFPHGDLRRCRRVASRDRRHHRRRAARAGAGGGRRRHPARGLPARGPGHLRRGRRADDRRRDPVGPGPHRAHLRLRPRGRRARHLRAGQGPRRRPLPRLGHRRRPRGARGDHPRVARLHLRRQPARRRDRPRGRHDARRGRVPGAAPPTSARCSPTGSPPSWAAPAATASPPCACAGCGPASTSSPAARAVASCASG